MYLVEHWCTGAGTSSQWKPYVNEDTDYTKWTVLREGDGGCHVHELQVALVQQGFWPGEDDMQWWQFSDATCSAVQSFQVSCPATQATVHGCCAFCHVQDLRVRPGAKQQALGALWDVMQSQLQWLAGSCLCRFNPRPSSHNIFHNCC